MERTSQSLLERLRQPSPEASWQRFVQLYTPILYGWALEAGLQQSDAADLVQDVFVILLQQLPNFAYDRAGSFRAWLRTVTMNKLRDHKRKGKPAELPVDVEAEADSFWDRDFRQALTQRALELMRTDFAPATWQACWEFLTTDKSAAEVARQFGLTENAVYLAKCRIIRRLRQELAGMID